MKLRRAMAAAAATAVIAPLALLSAPAAFADETTSPTPTETATSTPTELPSDTATPTATATDTTSPTNTSAPSDTSTPTASATDTSSPTATASESDEPEPSESAEPSEDPGDAPYCEDLDEGYGEGKVSADITGLPGKIVAGDGFHNFQLVVTNESKTDLNGVTFYAEIENYELDAAKFLSPYVDLEFKNPDTGSWDNIRDEDGYAGDEFFTAEQLKAKASESIDLRVSIDAKAPADDAYSFGSGTYHDTVDGQDCIAGGWVQYDFEVLKAGSDNTDPGIATPSDSDKKPQGGSTTTGNLADTGANSALPTIGLMSGVAVMAGAGAIYAVRRRRAGSNV